MIAWVVEVVAGFAFEFVFYTTALVLLPLVSLGRIQVEGYLSDGSGLNRLGYRRGADGRLVIGSITAGFIGLFVWLLALVALVAWSR